MPCCVSPASRRRNAATARRLSDWRVSGSSDRAPCTGWAGQDTAVRKEITVRTRWLLSVLEARYLGRRAVA